jgi:CheY-like chemotaxis protein
VQLEGIEQDLKYIGEDKRRRYGIEEIVVTTAASKNSAEALLKEAKAPGMPYDIMLLDLSLPREDHGKPEPAGLGLEILDLARRTGTVKSIVVVSAYTEYKTVASAFRAGAIDFIAKVYTREDLQNRVLACWHSVLLREAPRAFENRIKTLVRWAEEFFPHRFTPCFSRLLQSVVHEVEGMSADFAERLGLDWDKDSQDPLVRRLSTIVKAVDEAKKEWTGLQPALERATTTPHETILEELLEGIVNALAPCMILKCVEVKGLPRGRTRVLSFQDDVEFALKEIILGGMIALPDHGESTSLDISVTANERQAEVRVTDSTLPVRGEAAESINCGDTVERGDDFGREWGLSVVQHAALRGGGRLIVEPKSDGNMITYLIPLAQHVQGILPKNSARGAEPGFPPLQSEKAGHNA